MITTSFPDARRVAPISGSVLRQRWVRAFCACACCLRLSQNGIISVQCHGATTINICLAILPAPCTFWRNALVFNASKCVGNNCHCIHITCTSVCKDAPKCSSIYCCARATHEFREVEFSVSPKHFSTSLCCYTWLRPQKSIIVSASKCKHSAGVPTLHNPLIFSLFRAKSARCKQNYQISIYGKTPAHCALKSTPSVMKEVLCLVKRQSPL